MLNFSRILTQVAALGCRQRKGPALAARHSVSSSSRASIHRRVPLVQGPWTGDVRAVPSVRSVGELETITEALLAGDPVRIAHDRHTDQNAVCHAVRSWTERLLGLSFGEVPAHLAKRDKSQIALSARGGDNPHSYVWY